MIRPWYRSRLLWFGGLGLVVLLWTWWDSGAWFSRCDLHRVHKSSWGPASTTATLEMNRGTLGLWVSANAIDDNTKTGELEISADHYRRTEMGYPADLFAGDPLMERQFDTPAAVRLLREWDEALGDNPAAYGWVPSPSATLPKPELKSVRLEIAWWVMVLAYVLLGSLMMLGSQRRKIRLMRLSTESVS